MVNPVLDNHVLNADIGNNVLNLSTVTENLKTREFETFGSLSDFTSIDHNYCLMKEIQLVKVGFLNVCNLKSKICLPEFQQLVEKFDLFGCCETKLDNLDTINLSNFKCICSNRVKTRNNQVVFVYL